MFPNSTRVFFSNLRSSYFIAMKNLACLGYLLLLIGFSQFCVPWPSRNDSYSHHLNLFSLPECTYRSGASHVVHHRPPFRVSNPKSMSDTVTASWGGPVDSCIVSTNGELSPLTALLHKLIEVRYCDCVSRAKCLWPFL